MNPTKLVQLSHSSVNTQENGFADSPFLLYRTTPLLFLTFSKTSENGHLPRLCKHLRQSSYQAVYMATGAVQTPEKAILSHSAML